MVPVEHACKSRGGSAACGVACGQTTPSRSLCTPPAAEAPPRHPQQGHRLSQHKFHAKPYPETHRRHTRVKIHPDDRREAGGSSRKGPQHPAATATSKPWSDRDFVGVTLLKIRLTKSNLFYQIGPVTQQCRAGHVSVRPATCRLSENRGGRHICRLPSQTSTQRETASAATRSTCALRISVGSSGPTLYNNSYFPGVLCIITDPTNQDAAKHCFA